VPALLLEELGSEKHFFFSRGYWSEFERTFSVNMGFRYVVLLKNGEPAGFAPFQLIEFRGGNVSAGLHTHSWWQWLKKYVTIKIVNLVRLRLLVSGNIFITGEYSFFIRNGFQLNQQMVEAFHRAIEVIIRSEKNISGILIKDFYTETASHFHSLRQKGFLRFEVNPNMEMDIRPEWKQMTDYEQALSSRYRMRYRKAKERFGLLKFASMSASELIRYKAVMQQMLNEVMERSQFKLAFPDIDYMHTLLRRFPDNFYVTGIFKGEELLGYCSAYRDGDILIACFVGMDKNYLRPHDLYLNILYHLVGLAIQFRVKKLHFGRTAMEIKSSVGAEPRAMFLFVKHVCFVWNTLVHMAVKILSENPQWICRHPFRKHAQPVISIKN
jgi:hypothetical protein